MDLENKLTSSAKEWEALQQRAAQLEAEVGAAARCRRLPPCLTDCCCFEWHRVFLLDANPLWQPYLCPPRSSLYLLPAPFALPPPPARSSRPPSSSNTSCRERTPR